MEILLLIVVFVLFAFFVIATIGGIIAHFQGQINTFQEYLGLFLLIILSVIFGLLLFTGQLILY